MAVTAYDLSAGLFVRGLTNVNTQLTKAEEHAAARRSGDAAVLDAHLAIDGRGGGPAAPTDLHLYPLAAHVHWAAEGARVAIARLLGAPAVPATNVATSFAALHQRLDATIADLRAIAPSDLEAGLERMIVIDDRRGAIRASGSQFLVAFAIPHFFYHVTTAYGILRTHGVPLTMGDFLGTWVTS